MKRRTECVHSSSVGYRSTPSLNLVNIHSTIIKQTKNNLIRSQISFTKSGTSLILKVIISAEQNTYTLTRSNKIAFFSVIWVRSF